MSRTPRPERPPHPRPKTRRGFTLVEIMIVVLIVGVLSSIAVPSWISARTKSRKQACTGNLKKLETAKEQWTLENHVPEGSACDMTDLHPAYLKSVPRCPTAGTYEVHPVGERPTCNVAGHEL